MCLCMCDCVCALPGTIGPVLIALHLLHESSHSVNIMFADILSLTRICTNLFCKPSLKLFTIQILEIKTCPTIFTHTHAVWQSVLPSTFFITPCACAKGKVIGRAVVIILHTKITRSQLLGVSVSVQYGHNVKNGKKVMSLCFKALDKGHKGYKSCFLIGHAYRPHLFKLISHA